MMFRDRTGAGRILAEAVARLVRGRAVVAAIPRGGVVVGVPVAERLGAPLAVVHAGKLTVPLTPEFAVGALDEDGHAVVDPTVLAGLRVGQAELAEAQARAAREIGRRLARYHVPPLAHYLPAPTLVLVDDGLATGLTMQAALAYARRHGAERAVVAAPCASGAAAEALRAVADELVCPVVDEGFSAVSQYYLDFSPVEDAEVVALIAEWCEPEPSAARADSGGKREGGRS
jgi:putative phosphoribosyl transferase